MEPRIYPHINLAFYTCFYGSKENPAFSIPSLPSDQYDCYYFTNNKIIFEALQATDWIAVWDDVPTTDDLIEAPMVAARVRVKPSEYKELQPYDYLCFLDSKLDKVNELFVEGHIKEYFINRNYALCLREHWWMSGNVWEEAYYSIGQARYRKQWKVISDYIKSQIKAGWEQITDKHCATGLLIKNMRHKQTKDLEDVWWDHFQLGGTQGQITFFFVKQMFKEWIYIFRDNPFVEHDGEEDLKIV